MSSHDPLFFLNHQAYGTYSRALAKEIGLAPAVLLSEFVEKRHYHMGRGELIADPKHGNDWIYHTIEVVEERTGIHRKEQESALKKLSDLNFIEVKVFGLPARRHFRLNEEAILSYFSLSNKHSSLYKRTNCNGEKDKLCGIKEQTPHIYKEPKEEPKDIISPQSSKKQEKDSSQTISSKSPRAQKKNFYFCYDSRKYIGIDEQDLAEWKISYPSIDLRKCIADNCQWLLANSTRGKAMVNFRKHLTSWLRKAEEIITNNLARQANYQANPQTDRRTKNTDGTAVEVDYGW
jgi:hypothetical protein